jgi:hypothetical protein
VGHVAPFVAPASGRRRLLDPGHNGVREEVIVCAPLRHRASRAMKMRTLLRRARPHGGNAAERVKQVRPDDRSP